MSAQNVDWRGPDLYAIARDLRKRMTRAERVLWERVRDRRLAGYKFRRQTVLCGYIVDFYCAQASLVIEIDGEVHLDPDRAYADQMRASALRMHGYNVIRFQNPDVICHTDRVCDQIVEAVQSIIAMDTMETMDPDDGIPSPSIDGEGNEG
jgi:very-short-patch-repair endonuclease